MRCHIADNNIPNFPLFETLITAVAPFSTLVSDYIQQLCSSLKRLPCCPRSAEGRKRIISEIVRTLSPSTDQKPPAAGGMPSAEVLATIPFKQKDGFPPTYKVR